MKKFIGIMGFIIALCVPQIVLATNVGYDGGFFIQNDEGSFKLKMTGRVQPKIGFVKQTVVTTAIPTTRRTSFSMRRAELGFAAFIEDQLVFRIGMKHSTNSQNFNTVNVAYATATYEVIPEFVVTTGMVGLPLSIMAETSSKWLLLPDPPITELQDDGIENFTIARAAFNVPDGLGLNFAGDISKFFYSFSVVNGAESNYAFNPNSRFSFGARFGVNILDPVPGSMTDFECSSKPKLTLSAGTMYQARRIDANTNANLKYMLTGSLGIALRWGGFAFTTEGYYRLTRVTNPGTAAWARSYMDDIGYYAAVGYYIIPKKFEIAAQAAQIFREGPDNNSNSFGGGLNYYIFDNNFKLQLAYIWTQDYDDVWGAGNDNHIHNIVLMASALF